MKFILTCEHGGNTIPEEYKDYFKNAKEVLNSHRGYDPGALDLFQRITGLADMETSSETSRLLVELNRSLHHPQLFSPYTRDLSAVQKNEILERYYYPYRNAVESEITEALGQGKEVLHLSIHSFTPELNGEVRKTDIGLLFDPSRVKEKEFCRQFRNQLRALKPELVTRFNYPYLGIADGFPTYLRKIFPEGYSGVELEVNQKFVDEGDVMQEEIKEIIWLGLSRMDLLT